MNAAERYNAMVTARQQQQSRFATPFGESYWERFAHTYRFDPHHLPEASIREVIRRMEMEDDIIEVGGGAGRVGLTLALRGKSLRNVEPSAAMREQFRLAVWQHGIQNAEAIASSWPMEEAIRPIMASSRGSAIAAELLAPRAVPMVEPMKIVEMMAPT